ncbi:MAG: FGGY-family carbohydrate kinase, partial [Pseudomonadota bacterium]
MTHLIGIDFGTSGCRGVVLDERGTPLTEASVALPASRHHGAAVEQDPHAWWRALETLLPELLRDVAPQTVAAIALDGTSGTVLLSDSAGQPLSPALMYNDNRAEAEAAQIAALAPRECAAHGTGSGLAKALWLLARTANPQAQVHTQADWLTGRLCGRFDYSDANNVLKLGYDPQKHRWPAWLGKLGVDTAQLPTVLEPGSPIAPLQPDLARRWGLSCDTLVCAGTTDSTAAFIASGAGKPGEAVTSLGSTLVLKVIAEQPVFAPEYGVYSQPLGAFWLVGGGSNSGGAVLRHYFSDEQMTRLSAALHPDRPTGLDYYPLLAPGERFPVNDPQLQPRLTPRPESDAHFFQALLEGIAAIEKRGYELLAELGAPYPTSVRSNGGGARNAAWTEIRGQRLGVPMLPAEQQEACYGAAQLA